MDANFWKKRWEERKIAFHKDHFNPHLVEFWDKAITNKQGAVFVPLCGKSLDLLYFCERGRPVVGVELSSMAVEEFFFENKLSFEKQNHIYESQHITLYCDDFFKMMKEAVSDVTAIYDRASLIALPEEMRIRYAKKMAELFEPGVEYFLLANEFDNLRVGPPFGITLEMIHDYYGNHWEIKKIFEIEEKPEEIDVHPGEVKRKINRGFYLKRR